MANLYESMNKYFETQYGSDLDGVKKVEKKSLNESKQKLGARKAMQEAKDPSNFPRMGRKKKAIKESHLSYGTKNKINEAAGFPKYFLAFDHFEPDTLFTIKVNDEKQLKALKGWESWYIKDITNKKGFYLIGHSDEAFYLNKLPASNKEALRKLMVDELKQQIKEDEEFFDYPETHLDCIDEDVSLDLDLSEDDDEAAVQIADNWFESIDDSYVDGDSSFEFKFVTMEEEKKNAADFSEFDSESGDEGFDESCKSIVSRKAMKEARNPSNYPVAKALIAAGIKMDGDINSPAAAKKFADKVISVLEDAKKDASKSDVAQFDRAIDIVNKRRNSPALLLTTIGTFYTGYKSNAGAPEKKDECVDVKPVSEKMSRKSRMMKEARHTSKAEGPYTSIKVDSSLGESKRIVSRKAMKEDLGKDIARYQRYVDYDMKHYGEISKKTQDFIDKAGLQVVKDQYGDYEVTAGRYEEACKSHRFARGMQEKKNLDECDCKDCTCDGACTCTDEHSCCGEGERSHEVIKEAKKKKKGPDLWETIYGDLTDDGTQRINPETGHPYINLGAGYNYQDQVAVDRDGNIVVKTKEERDLKAAIDIADKYKDKGVTYNIDQSKYDKKYPYWMTIEIPEEYKECFKESKLTEKRWAYTVSDNVSREFRDAVQSDDEDYERVRKAIIAVYDDIHENTDLIDDDDYEDWVTEEAEVVDLDDEDDVNYLLTQLYDFCDNASIWIGI